MPNLQLESLGQVVCARRDTHGSSAAEVNAAPGRRATAPARPVNNEGQQDQSAADNPKRVRGRCRSYAVVGFAAANFPEARGSARRPADHDPAPRQRRGAESLSGPDRGGEGCTRRSAVVAVRGFARLARHGFGRIGQQDVTASGEARWWVGWAADWWTTGRPSAGAAGAEASAAGLGSATRLGLGCTSSTGPGSVAGSTSAPW